MKIIRSSLVALLAASYAAPSQAILDVVITSAARTEQTGVSIPASIKTITADEIEASGASHVVDVLRSESTLLIEDSFGDGSRAVISMRGFSGSTANSNTLILVDGRRLNNNDISSPDLNSVSLKDVERIEIIEGSAGVIYGDQAVGGVVNIITKRIKGRAAVIEASAGSYHTAGLRAAFSDDLTEKVHYDLSAEVRRSDNYRRQNNEIEYLNLLAKTDYRYSDGEVFAEVQHVGEDLGTPGSLIASEMNDRRQTFVDFLGDYTDSQTDVIRLGLRHKLDEHWSLEAEATVRDVEREIQQSFRGWVVTTPSTLERKQTELTPRLIASVPVENGHVQLTAGFDFIDTDFSSQITASSDAQVMSAKYAQLVLSMQDKLDITAGYRHASVEDDVTSTYTNGRQSTSVDVAEFGLRYHLSEEMDAYARVDQNFRFAKVDELTYVSPGTSLRPQTGNSFEAGINYSDETVSYELSFYQLALKDEIAFDPSAPQPVGAFFAGANVNFDPTTHRGVSLDVSRELSERFDINASYSYSDASFDSGVFAGNTISGVPENSASVSVNYEHSSVINVLVAANYVGSRYLDGDNANSLSKLPNHTVINSNLIYQHNDLRFNLRVNNLTNRRYVENANSFGSLFPSPERNFLLTATWEFR